MLPILKQTHFEASSARVPGCPTKALDKHEFSDEWRMIANPKALRHLQVCSRPTDWPRQQQRVDT